MYPDRRDAFASIVVVVGQFVPTDGEPEDALAQMRGADVNSTREDRLNCVAQAFQICGDLVEPEGGMAGNVLSEDESRSALSDDSDEILPDASSIVMALTKAGLRERLARISCDADIHRTAQRSSSEGPHI